LADGGHIIYFNFFTIGALIPVVFHFLITVFFLSIPEKSRATLHLGIAFLFITLFNLAYVIAASVYHPMAAYHRWLTVGVIMLAETHYTLFLFNYPHPGRLKTERLIQIPHYLISFLMTGVFMWVSFKSGVIYHFDGHYWDFTADDISKVVGIVLALYLVPFTGIFIYKMIRIRGRERWVIFFMGIAYLVGSLIPAIANAISREGLIDRQFFQIIWAMVNIFGFFFLAIIYINNTRDQSTFMAKIAGISMVTFLVLLQGVSYFALNDKEQAYDEIHRQMNHRIVSAGDNYQPPQLAYVTAYDAKARQATVEYQDKGLRLDTHRIKQDLENAWFFKKISETHGKGRLRRLLTGTWRKSGHLAGYIRSLGEFAAGQPDGLTSTAIRAYIEKLEFYVGYYRRKVRNMPAQGVREAVGAFLDSNKATLSNFNITLWNHLAKSESHGNALKSEILAYLQPLRPSGERFYRKLPADSQHVVAFVHQAGDSNRIYELGFSYGAYRQYIHPAATKMILLLFGLILFALVGFRLFFLGTFIHPMHMLVDGVKRVNWGDLNVSIPVRAGDEIGYLTQAFNRMVGSIKASNQELNDTRLYLKNIFDSMPSMLIGVDHQGRVTHWNQEAERITRLAEDRARGEAIEKLIPQFAQYLENVHAAINQRKSQKIEKVAYQLGGETRYSDIVVYPLTANGVKGAVVRVDDITSRVRFEEMMVQSEKMASVGGLAAGMAHEINNPLGGIMMAAQNIERRVSPDLKKNHQVAEEVGTHMAAVSEYMQKRGVSKMLAGILEMGQRASDIVANMLNFSRKSETRRSSQNINQLIDETIELAANDYNLKKQYDFRHIEISRDYEPGLPMILCIRTEIQQVFLNLLKNAAQAMAEKTYESESPQIRIHTARAGDMVRVEVADNGPGMPDSVRKRIFEPFFTTKEVGTGTGLGLSVSYFIVTNNHGGQMEVSARAGKGTRFIIKLPAAE